jgi:hypothetical protein
MAQGKPCNIRFWIPPIAVMIKKPGSQLDAHLTTNAVFEAVLVAEIRSPQGFP